ncbi:MSH6-like protein [Mya arenaria]|uniref:DNA mismatch repair protein n=1 Tax=Mya arenaria TaxID=6604 RepID=A0ABY7DUD4_MYAAR|nr:MSH6-like protein [Mya arenaria]
MGPPKSTPAKQKNTLFTYFSKSPCTPQSDDTSKNIENTVLSPKKSPNRGKNQQKTNGPDSSYKPGDLIWGKLEGYPWWPSLVCNHPTENNHYKPGKLPQIHVQFFDNPVSRAWVKLKNCKKFKGSDDPDFQPGGPLHTKSTPVVKGVEEADHALGMSCEERLGLVVELQPSDDEDDMQSDDDSGEGNSKENMDVDEDVKKTPSKSPAKGRRSQRSQRKRRRIIIEDSDSDGHAGSEDEFKPGKDDGSDDEASSGVDEDDITSESASEPDSPIKLPQKRKRPEPKQTWGPKTARKQEGSKTAKKALAGFSKDSSDTEEKLPSPSSPATPRPVEARSDTASTPQASPAGESGIVYQHLKYEWLKADNIRDAKKRVKTDEDYDPRTLYIPDGERTKFTPMGKFYELFHMDAAIGVKELGLIFMKGDYAHSGFPEIAYGRYADTLVQRGYRVARIEQTETPDMMTERCKNMSKAPTKYDKVVNREVCRITTRGTKTFSFLSGECTDSHSTYLLALTEKIGQFSDDRHCSRLRTLLAHYPPVQILYERGRLTARTQQMISATLPSVMKEGLNPRTEFWDSSKTLKVLSEETYFKPEGEDFQWPPAIKDMLSDSDALGCSAADEYSLAVSSLGGLTWYLQYCLLDEELLSMRNFDVYRPLDNERSALSPSPNQGQNLPEFTGRHMVLDGVTLANLDVTENSSTGTTEGTLLERLDTCHTPFGKRLFRQWLCAPLCNPASIKDRLDAVEDLIGCQDITADVADMMKKLPDLERLLSRIHTLGTAKSKKHPDARAILYEDITYSKRKIEDFLSTLEGFKISSKIARRFKDVVGNFKSQMLGRTLGIAGSTPDGMFPDIKEQLEFFDNSFDHNKAKKDGVIVPSKGVDSEYDRAIDDMRKTENNLKDYLDKQKTRIGCRSITYWGSGKNRYQMEVPDSYVKNVPHQYQLMSSKKGTKRYRTGDIEEMLEELTDAEDRKDSALKDMWDGVVQCLSVLDVLLALACYSRCADGAICRPEIVSPEAGVQPFIEIREARHPCVCRTFSGGDFIPNDTVIGTHDDQADDGDSSSSRVVLVTGPNMGGKSTLMRQVGLVVVMAQLGCYVPAEKCRLTPVDRVFTRLGANDRIMAGESTFFVELSETSAILQHATSHSLVLVDELAIACSVVKELSTSIGCRTLFSTHYHSLVEEFSHDPNIRLGHMACMVENEDEDDPTQETITFLYKFTSGACPKSYGFNAARLANLPDEEGVETADKGQY